MAPSSQEILNAAVTATLAYAPSDQFSSQLSPDQRDRIAKSLQNSFAEIGCSITNVHSPSEESFKKCKFDQHFIVTRDSNETVYIGFRGSDGWDKVLETLRGTNWTTSPSVNLMEGVCTNSFLSSILAVVSFLYHNQSCLQVILTGHSLGGTLAQMVAEWLINQSLNQPQPEENKFSPSQPFQGVNLFSELSCITFGSPWASASKDSVGRIYAVIFSDDPIPQFIHLTGKLAERAAKPSDLSDFLMQLCRLMPEFITDLANNGSLDLSQTEIKKSKQSAVVQTLSQIFEKFQQRLIGLPDYGKNVTIELTNQGFNPSNLTNTLALTLTKPTPKTLSYNGMQYYLDTIARPEAPPESVAKKLLGIFWKRKLSNEHHTEHRDPFEVFVGLLMLPRLEVCSLITSNDAATVTVKGFFCLPMQGVLSAEGVNEVPLLFNITNDIGWNVDLKTIKKEKSFFRPTVTLVTVFGSTSKEILPDVRASLSPEEYAIKLSSATDVFRMAYLLYLTMLSQATESGSLYIKIREHIDNLLSCASLKLLLTSKRQDKLKNEFDFCYKMLYGVQPSDDKDYISFDALIWEAVDELPIDLHKHFSSINNSMPPYQQEKLKGVRVINASLQDWIKVNSFTAHTFSLSSSDNSKQHLNERAKTLLSLFPGYLTALHNINNIHSVPPEAGWQTYIVSTFYATLLGLSSLIELVVSRPSQAAPINFQNVAQSEYLLLLNFLSQLVNAPSPLDNIILGNIMESEERLLNWDTKSQDDTVGTTFQHRALIKLAQSSLATRQTLLSLRHVVLFGSSRVGKSTLLNDLLPQFNIPHGISSVKSTVTPHRYAISKEVNGENQQTGFAFIDFPGIHEGDSTSFLLNAAYGLCSVIIFIIPADHALKVDLAKIVNSLMRLTSKGLLKIPWKIFLNRADQLISHLQVELSPQHQEAMRNPRATLKAALEATATQADTLEIKADDNEVDSYLHVFLGQARSKILQFPDVSFSDGQLHDNVHFSCFDKESYLKIGHSDDGNPCKLKSNLFWTSLKGRTPPLVWSSVHVRYWLRSVISNIIAQDSFQQQIRVVCDDILGPE